MLNWNVRESINVRVLTLPNGDQIVRCASLEEAITLAWKLNWEDTTYGEVLLPAGLFNLSCTTLITPGVSGYAEVN